MNMKRSVFLILAAIMIFGAVGGFADEGPLDSAQPKGVTPEEIIQHFAAKEKEFKEARDQYTYRQDVQVKTPDDNGEYHEVFDVTFDDQGKKLKNVVFAPQSTLERIIMTQEDIDDIENRLPFVLTSDEINEYNILYVGQQQEDELHCYVFDIAPKQFEGKKRYFSGRIWVDDHDFQIVKTYGKAVPESRKKKDKENLFPKFTTWREQVDNTYWFPTYTRADDTLNFSTGGVHVVEVVRYQNYKKFGAKSKILFEGKDVAKNPQPDTQPKPEAPQK
jgi:outer membrane lipoprotein-sorting protein